MEKLNFPPFEFRFKSSENTLAIFDPIRKKFVILTPEEWVRQHTLCFLNMTLGYPKSLISVEKEILLNTTKKRYDIIIFNRDGSIHLIVECKAPQIKIDQSTFDQIARYNLKLNATYLMVTNGLNHYYCQMDYDAKKYNFLRDIPSYSR
ncbi:MAG: type I restriction enzyme HsdR N-terminal domain-containing protein [Leeuwenhoekiella sp.]